MQINLRRFMIRGGLEETMWVQSWTGALCGSRMSLGDIRTEVLLKRKGRSKVNMPAWLY